MANRAALFRAEYNRPVTRRGRRFIEFDNGDGTITHVATIEPLHYSASEDQEIDTAWITSVDAAWQWQLLENDFQIHARSFLNTGDLIQWLDTRSGESVIVDPQSINWVDNVTDSRQQISTKQAVQATASDASLLWSNGYGTGRHFRYTAHPKRLIKHVIIDALANLPAPTVSNPYFEIEFVIKKSAGVTLYIDGQPWDNSTKTTTANRIEYRLADGTVAWYVPAPIAEDSNGDTCPGLMQVRRQGGTRYCTVRFPKAWIDAATFPIYVDDSFTDGYGGNVATSRDAMIYGGAASSNFGASNYLLRFGSNASGLIQFDLSSIDADATCTSATIYGYQVASSGSTAFTATIYSLTSANSNWVEGIGSYSDCNDDECCFWYKGFSDNFWASGETYEGPTVSGTDYEATSLGSFSGNSGDANGTAYTEELTASRIEAWFGATNTNYGLIIFLSANPGQVGSSDHATTDYRPKLVVVYTAGGPAPAENNQAQVSNAASLTFTGPTYNITGAEGAQAQASDAASITAAGPTYPITAIGNNQAQVSDAVTLGVYTPIVSAEDNQAQVSDAASLTANGPTYPVTAAQNNQAQVSDAATLGVYHIISPAQNNQGQASDAASISVQGATRWTTYWNTQFDQDQEAWVTLAHIAGTIRLWGRMVNPTGYGVDLRGYYAQYANGTVIAARYNDATTTDEGLGTAAVVLSDGDKLWMRLEGAQVSVYTYQASAWTKRIDVADASPALEDGYIGIDATDATAILDDFGGGALTVDITAAQNNQAQVSDAASLSFEAPTAGITVAEENQAQVSDAVTMGAIHPVTAAQANQAQVSDAASLTSQGPTYNVTAADNNQAQVSDAATLGVIHIISPAENNQAQVSDAASITSGEVIITAAQANQAQVSDAALLGVYTPIAPSQQNQAQVSDAASITFSGIELVNITAAQNNQAQTSDAVSISAYYPVAPSQQNQAQVSDTISISANGPEYAVSVSDATQAQVSDAAVFGVITPITIADATQAQVSDLAVLTMGGLITHGERRLYKVNTRATNYVGARPTHKVNKRETYEVDD